MAARNTGLLWRSAAAVAAVVAWALPAIAAGVPLPVPKVAIYPGETIGADAVEPRAFDAAWSARMPVAQQSSDVVGKVARRTLLPGQPIPVNAIRTPDAVQAGKIYRIVFRDGGLVISGNAVALTPGAVGDMVSLRNPDSGSVVRGIVSDDGTVRISAQ